MPAVPCLSSRCGRAIPIAPSPLVVCPPDRCRAGFRFPANPLRLRRVPSLAEAVRLGRRLWGDGQREGLHSPEGKRLQLAPCLLAVWCPSLGIAVPCHREVGQIAIELCGPSSVPSWGSSRKAPSGKGLLAIVPVGHCRLFVTVGYTILLHSEPSEAAANRAACETRVEAGCILGCRMYA